MASAPTGGVDPALDDDIELAVADLAARLEVDETAIATVSATIVTWPDGGLGCRQPGRAYTQVPVDGSEIVLAANGKQYSYHSGGSTPPFLCEIPATAKSTVPGSLPRLPSMTQPSS